MTLRRPRGAGSNVHVALALAQAWYVLGELEKTIEAARHASRLALGSGPLYALARREEAVALHDLGKVGQAVLALDDALRVLQGLADPWSLAHAYELKAGMVQEQGDLDGARRLYESALASFQESQDRRGEGRALVSLATVCYQQGRHEDARAWFEAALPVLDQLGAQQESAVARVNFGAFLQEQGDVDGALAALAALAAEAADGGRRLDAFEARLAAGEIELAAGRVEAARVRLAELRGEAADAGVRGIVRRLDGFLDGAAG